MLTLPDEYNTLFTQLRPYFSKRVWKLAMIMLVGAILAPGKRTVTAILRIMGLSQERHFPWPIRPGQAKLPSGAKPGGMVEHDAQFGFVTLADQYVSSCRADCDRDR